LLKLNSGRRRRRRRRRKEDEIGPLFVELWS
jgi:hypothetical protein